MKKLLTTILITLASTSSFAEINDGMSQSESSEDGTYFKQLPVVTKVDINSSMSGRENNMLELWKSLDTNNDDFLSKTEAAESKMIEEHWSKLDINKDKKLDFIEFAQITEQEN